MNMTYRQLLNALNELSENDLDLSVSLFDTNTKEVYPLVETTLVSELPSKYREEVEDVLTNDHPILVFAK